MSKRMILLVIALIVSMIIAFATTNKEKAVVTYVDKSVSLSGKISFWVQIEGSSYLRQVNYPAKIGEIIAISTLSISSVIFLILALSISAYIIYFTFEDVNSWCK